MGRPRDLDGTEPSLAWLGESSAGSAIEVREIARIWATVDLERALADLGVDGRRAARAIEDPLLGARVVVIPPGAQGELEADGVPLALAEPSTEGRLAGVLARHGEGPAGRYLAAPCDLDAARRLATAAGVALTRAEVGPFGRAVLVLGGPPQGWSVILVDPAAVPSRR